MAYYDALIAKWPDVTGATTADKLAALNAETVAGAAPTTIYAPRGELINAIVPADLAGLTAIQLSQLTFAWGSDQVDVTSGSLPYLAATTFFAGKTTTLNKLGAVVSKYAAAPSVPWWQANNYPHPIHIGDVVIAGLDAATGYSASIGTPTPDAGNLLNLRISVSISGPNGTLTVTAARNALTEDYAKYFAADQIAAMVARDAALATFPA